MKKDLIRGPPALPGRRRQGQRQGDAQSRRALCRGHRRQARLCHRGEMVPPGGASVASPTANTISGCCAARGLGTDKNFIESYKWFALAAAQGDAESAKKRDEVARASRGGRPRGGPADGQNLHAATAAGRGDRRAETARRLGQRGWRRCPTRRPRLLNRRRGRSPHPMPRCRSARSPSENVELAQRNAVRHSCARCYRYDATAERG